MDANTLRTLIRMLDDQIRGMEGHHAPGSFMGNKLDELKQRRRDYQRQLNAL